MGPLPPLQLSLSSSSSADGRSQSAFDASGFNVNFNRGALAGALGGGVPSWAIVAGLVIAGVWLLRKGR